MSGGSRPTTSIQRTRLQAGRCCAETLAGQSPPAIGTTPANNRYSDSVIGACIDQCAGGPVMIIRPSSLFFPRPYRFLVLPEPLASAAIAGLWAGRRAACRSGLAHARRSSRSIPGRRGSSNPSHAPRRCRSGPSDSGGAAARRPADGAEFAHVNVDIVGPLESTTGCSAASSAALSHCFPSITPGYMTGGWFR